YVLPFVAPRAAGTRLNTIVGVEDPILVTGSTGFLGTRVAAEVLEQGFRNVRCFARASSDARGLEKLAARHDGSRVEVIRGNLLSPGDCDKPARDVRVVYHLAGGTGQKSFPDAFMNSVRTPRNRLDAAMRHGD